MFYEGTVPGVGFVERGAEIQRLTDFIDNVERGGTSAIAITGIGGIGYCGGGLWDSVVEGPTGAA